LHNLSFEFSQEGKSWSVTYAKYLKQVVNQG